MLVLGRKAEQSILIGADIKIRIIEVQGKLVKIGIDAPRDMTVLREELLNVATFCPDDIISNENSDIIEAD